jgi:hypothetical protein
MHLGITASRGEQQIEGIADIAGKELGWDDDVRHSRIKEFLQDLNKEKRF